MTTNTYTNDITDKQARIERVLEQHLPSSNNPLHDAMRYSTLQGGKRIRPLLVYGAGLAFNAPLPILDILAASVELIHCYSLIHDDLPAMDNDDLRRGKASLHKQFDEATAILAGDALQSLAFSLLSTEPKEYLHPDKRVLYIQTLAKAAGPEGMVLGQMLDMSLTGQAVQMDDVVFMQQLKTGRLLQAAIQLGILAGTENRNAKSVRALHQFGQSIGFAFQIKDDILDIESSTATLGKPQFSDITKDKPTYIKAAGAESAHKLLDTLIKDAQKALTVLGDAGHFLRDVTLFMLERHV